MNRLALSLPVIAAVAVGCAIPLSSAAAAPKSAPARVSAPATAAAKPVVGVNLYATANYPASKVTADGVRMLSYIKKTLNANAVGIVWNLYAPSSRSTRVEATNKTLTAANVATLTTLAEQDGLKVFYRPLIFISHTSRTWEGNIAPTSAAKWFSSYYKVELPYLKDAQRFHIAEFVADTEMHALNRNSGWPGFYKKIARVYHGVVSYASWDGDYFPPHTHLQRVRSVGLDFYEPMPRLPASASEARVFASWESFFNKVPRSVRVRTTIDELGIEARAGAYASPQNLAAKGKLDQKVQANWFTAACKAVHKYGMRGVFFWKVDLADNPFHATSAESVFEGRQGAKAIASCAAILR